MNLTLECADVGRVNGLLILLVVRVDKYFLVGRESWLGDYGYMAFVALSHKVKSSLNLERHEAESGHLGYEVLNFVSEERLDGVAQLLSSRAFEHSTTVLRDERNHVRIDLTDNECVHIEELTHTLHRQISCHRAVDVSGVCVLMMIGNNLPLICLDHKLHRIKESGNCSTSCHR